MNVGAQGVSLTDLMQLGIPRLNAMAQGQQQSIAPSYMVIAALKALTDQQKGMGVPPPQGTVKDQVMAAAQPHPQPGIAGMMPQQAPQMAPHSMAPQPVPQVPPVQRMRVGGSVKHFDDGGSAYTSPPDNTFFGKLGQAMYEIPGAVSGAVGNAYDSAKDFLLNDPSSIFSSPDINGLTNAQIVANMRKAVNTDNGVSSDSKGQATKATKPTTTAMPAGFSSLPAATQEAILQDAMASGSPADSFNYNIGGVQGTTSPLAQGAKSAGAAAAVPPAALSSPAPAAGISATDVADANPYARYAQANVPTLKQYPDTATLPSQDAMDARAAAYSKQYQDQMPQNQQLAAAYAKYSAPDPQRLAEYAKNEQQAGLGAFAAAISKGRGLGGVIGPAAEAARAATEAAVEHRQNYEDARQAMAANLGVKLGDEARQNFIAATQFGSDKSAAAFNQADKALQLGTEQTGQYNTNQIQLFQAQMIAQANDIARQGMLDQRDQAALTNTLAAMHAQQQATMQRADDLYGKPPPITDPMYNMPAVKEMQRQKANYLSQNLQPLLDQERTILQQYSTRAGNPVSRFAPPNRGIASLPGAPTAGGASLAPGQVRGPGE